MTTTAPKLVISKIEFDISALASSLRLPPESVAEAFRDGRGAWPFSELWGERLFDFIKHSNTNNPVSDGAVALEQLRDFKISVKALTQAGNKFQQSKFVGFGRSSTKDGLIASLEACDRVVVVDVTEFPSVAFIPIDATRLLSAAHKDILTVGGWKKKKLYSWLQTTYSVTQIGLVL